MRLCTSCAGHCRTVALATGSQLAAPGGGDDPIELAAAALERLDQEINGGASAPVRADVDCLALAQSAVGRWRSRATIAEATLVLRWSAGHVTVEGDRRALAQALDNLILNAIEHGGSSIVVAVRQHQGRLRIAVVDSGRVSRPRSRLGSPAEVVARLSGRRRHGHGLAVVRRVASVHGGRFVLRSSERGTLAVLELPLASSRVDLVA